jgi:hypothetical protein
MIGLWLLGYEMNYGVQSVESLLLWWLHKSNNLITIKGVGKMGMEELKKPIRLWIDVEYEDLVLEYLNYNIIRLPYSLDNLEKLKKELKKVGK